MARLTPKDILDISEPVEAIYQRTVDELLINIAHHFKITGWERTRYWEIKKLSEMGALTKESAAIIAKNTGMLPEEVEKAFLMVSEKACLDIDPQLRKAAAEGILQDPMTTATTSPAMREMMQAYTDQALDKMNMVNTTMLESTRQVYLQTITTAVNEAQFLEAKQILETQSLAVTIGQETRVRAIRKATEQLSKTGLVGFYDKRGRAWSPEAYVSMVVRTTSHNASIRAIQTRQREYGGGDIFQVSSHPGARPLCYPYQGKFFSWSSGPGEFIDGAGRQQHYDNINDSSYGEPAGLFGINCGHHPIPMIPGFSYPQDGPIQDEEENRKAYEESQVQRQYERNIRTAKRDLEIAKATGDKELVKDMRQKVQQEQARMRAFIDDTGRARRYDREQILADSAFTSSAESAYNTFRRTSNLGTPFEGLKEPLQMRHVNRIISEMGIDYSDVKISIKKDPGLIGYNLFGYTNPSGTQVHLYPDAFKDREQLVKTLGHERTHVEQVRLRGAVEDSLEGDRREEEAQSAEKYWWKKYQKKRE